MTTAQQKTVLITGCSEGGIGWAMAKNLHTRGYYVFATLRDRSKAADLAELSNIELLELDVTKSETIERCKEIVTQRTGGKLDILVNNAGQEFLDPLLDTDLTQAKALYDVNVWGTLTMVQAFAPLLIEARGTIINQSSIDAVLNMAWAGIFASSKAALTRISETLRLELEPLGVRVVTAMNGSADTPMFTKPGGQLSLPSTSYYNGVQETAYKERMDHRRQATKVEDLAEMVIKDALHGARGQIWHGSFAFLVRMITWLLPTTRVDKLINDARGLPQVRRL